MIPILYYLWVYPPPKPILVWMVWKWRQLRSDATEGVHFCMFGSDLWPRITIAFSYLSILLVPFNACCWRVSPVVTEDKKEVPVLTYTCIPEEVDIGSEYSSVPSYSYGYYDDLDDNGVNIKKYPDGVERRGSTKVVDDDQWDEHVDPESGHPYFIHKISKVTVWERPKR